MREHTYNTHATHLVSSSRCETATRVNGLVQRVGMTYEKLVGECTNVRVCIKVYTRTGQSLYVYECTNTHVHMSHQHTTHLLQSYEGSW
jgi:hypothetical protein